MTTTPEEEPPLFALEPALRALRFVRTALRRRRLLVASVFVLFGATGIVAAMVLPRTYSASLRMLVKRQFLMPALTHPSRAVPLGAEAPAQSAAELALQYDGLLQVVRNAKLAERWRSDRPELLRLVDAARERVRGPLAPEEMEAALVEVLQQRLRVQVQEEVVTIRATWWDRDGVVAIVTEAHKAFLDARRRMDIETIEASRTILANTVDSLTSETERRVAAYGDSRRAAQGVRTSVLLRASGGGTVDEVRRRIVDRRLERETLARKRRERRAELDLQLVQQSATLGERHPDLIATREALARLDAGEASASMPSPEDQALEREFASLGGTESLMRDPVGERDRLADQAPAPDEDESVIYARALLRIDVDKLQDMVARLRNADLELATARAATPFRYLLTQPVARPRAPDAPNAPLVVIGGLLAGLAAGMAAAVVLELRARALLAPKRLLAVARRAA